MKKFLALIIIGLTFAPVLAADVSTPNVESVKSFAMPYDARFQYSLPENKSINVFNHNKTQNVNTSSDYDYGEDEDVVLDTQNLKPEKKVIKRITADSPAPAQNYDEGKTPMNYDSFPKFYNSNDMMNQQFMPMMGY